MAPWQNVRECVKVALQEKLHTDVLSHQWFINRCFLFVQGQRGPVGLAGPSGGRGAQGLKGEQGVDGLTGPSGPSGGVGLQGGPGNQGPGGSTGQKGDRGTAGNSGSVGPPGTTGQPGPAGAPGPVGSTVREYLYVQLDPYTRKINSVYIIEMSSSNGVSIAWKAYIRYSGHIMYVAHARKCYSWPIGLYLVVKDRLVGGSRWRHGDSCPASNNNMGFVV